MDKSNTDSNLTMPATQSFTPAIDNTAALRRLAEKAGDDKIMQNMKRMSQDETYRLEIAQRLS